MYMQITQEIHESRDISWEVIHRYFDEMIAADQMYEATQRFRKEGKWFTPLRETWLLQAAIMVMGTDKILQIPGHNRHWGDVLVL